MKVIEYIPLKILLSPSPVQVASLLRHQISRHIFCGRPKFLFSFRAVFYICFCEYCTVHSFQVAPPLFSVFIYLTCMLYIFSFFFIFIDVIYSFTTFHSPQEFHFCCLDIYLVSILNGRPNIYVRKEEYVLP